MACVSCARTNQPKHRRLKSAKSRRCRRKPSLSASCSACENGRMDRSSARICTFNSAVRRRSRAYSSAQSLVNGLGHGGRRGEIVGLLQSGRLPLDLPERFLRFQPRMLMSSFSAWLSVERSTIPGWLGVPNQPRCVHRPHPLSHREDASLIASAMAAMICSATLGSTRHFKRAPDSPP